MPTTTLKPFQQRVVDEKSALDEKLSRLRVFIGSDCPASTTFLELPREEQNRMIAQCRVMTEYSSILGDRIAAFE